MGQAADREGRGADPRRHSEQTQVPGSKLALQANLSETRNPLQGAFTAMITDDVQLGANVVIHQPSLVNLYGCVIGADTKIGAFVEIQRRASVGCHCKISSHTFICEGV